MYILLENMLKETPFLCLFLVEHQTISSFCTKGDPPFFLVAQPVQSNWDGYTLDTFDI